MMTLDGAIEHANQVADSYKDTAPACKCAHEHRQLADWLTELKVLHTENAKLQASNELIAEDHAALCEQNAKLRELAKGLYEFAYAEYPSAAKAGFADDLRKLGVEVDG